MANARKVYDGFTSLEGGVDTGLAPNLLAANQVSFAVNTNFRGGSPQTRPPFRKIKLNFLEDQTVETRFTTRFWQGACFYCPDSGDPSLITHIGGRLFRIELDNADYFVSEISPAELNPSLEPGACLFQAENYVIVLLHQNRPFIYDGATTRLANEDEVPAGNVGAYGMGRIWIGLPDGRSFRGGDLVFGPSGTSANNYRDAVIKFTENDYVDQGGDFQSRIFGTPYESGPITGMIFTQTLDTSLGQGPLLVFTENMVFSVNAPFDRTEWQNLTYPIQTIASIGTGAASHSTLVNQNGDVFFRSFDGIRSFMMARRDFNSWNNTPVSREMNRILALDTKSLLQYGSSVIFDNRLLQTCSPHQTTKGITHRGLSVLDFDLVSSMRTKMPPAWEGIWTGLNILQVVTGIVRGEPRCFVFALGESSDIQLWELLLDGRGDEPDNKTQVPIQCFMEGKSHAFGNPFQVKKLDNAELWVDNLQGTVSFDVKFRPDQLPCWLDWHDWSECATIEQCNPAECAEVTEYRPQYRPRMRLPMPPEDCNIPVGRRSNEGYEFSARIAWAGKARIKQLRLSAYESDDEPYGECRGEETCQTEACCPETTWDYSSEG